MPAIPAPDDRAPDDAGGAVPRMAGGSGLGLAPVVIASAQLKVVLIIRVRRQDLAGAGQAQHEDAVPQPAATRQHQDRAVLAARVRPCRPC